MKKSIKKMMSLCMAVIMLASMFCITALAEDTPTAYTQFDYSLNSTAKTITLGTYNGTDTAVVVPGSYDISGTTYTTVINSEAAFVDNTSITSVTLKSGVKFKNNSMFKLFSGCTALASVDLSEISTTGVTTMAHAFRYCSSLTALDLSNFDTSKVTSFGAMFDNAKKLVLSGYENLDTSSLTSLQFTFNYLQAKQALDLSNWDLSNVTSTTACFQFATGLTDLKLPDSLPIMNAFMLNHMTGYSQSSFTIPAGVKKMGFAHTIYDFGKDSTFTEFIVAEGNTSFKAVDGILYSMDGTTIIAVPRGKTFTDNTFEIPEGVTFLPELSFSRNKKMTKVVLPNSYKIRQYVPLNDPQYIVDGDEGNVNAGNSLSIAFYCYTGITDYEVKEDNPYYSSNDGIIYSKDMSTVIAVPTNYNKYINIPEGVTRWEENAMWVEYNEGMSSSTGVYIPASMTYIAPDQVKKINQLKNSYDFTITVDESNPVYQTNDSGQLVQYGISEENITLSQNSYVYDGTEKKPDVTVTVQTGITSTTTKTLTAGTHYTVEYIDNVEVGVAKVKVTGIGTYSGEVYKTFNITKIDVEEDFEVYDQEASAASSLTTGGDRYVAQINDVDSATWKAASSGFGNDGAAHAGITADPTDSTNNVLAIESRTTYNNWAKKPKVIYEKLDVDTANVYTYTFDFYKSASTAGGGVMVNYDGTNYYAIDFNGRNDHAYGYSSSATEVYSTVVVKNGTWQQDATINTDPETTVVSRTAHDYIPNGAWYTMELTVVGGNLSWTVKLASTGATVQTGSWTDSSPITGTDLSFALFAGGQNGQYMYFDNVSVARSEAEEGGDDNTGDDNTGDDNTGDDNTGDDTTGGDTTGDDNTGDDTTGDDNTGDDNTGDNTVTTTGTVATDNFNSYDQEASAASSLTTGGNRYVAQINDVDATTWKAASSGFGTDGAAHAGITADPADSTNNVLAIESRAGYSSWSAKPKIFYKNLAANSTDTYTYKFDFYKSANTAGGGIMVSYDGTNYYAVDFVGRNDHGYGYSAEATEVYSTVAIKNGEYKTDAVINTDPETTTVSRVAHDFIPSAAWYTMELTVAGGSLNWTVKLTSTGATVQTGSWTDSEPITGDSLSFALFAGGQNGQYMYFDNLTVTKTTATEGGGDDVTEPTYSVDNATLTVEFSPESIENIETMEKLQIIVANYESGTNILSSIEVREVTDLTAYISEDFAYSGAEGYTKIYIWNGDVAEAIPAYQAIDVE